METPLVVKTGDLYWCEPDPKDTVGSEQKKDRPWLIVSMSHLHRGNCVVGLPLSTQVEKARAHLIAVPADELTMDGKKSQTDMVALTDQIRSLDKTRFRRKAGTISQRGLDAVLLGIQALFGL